MFIEGLGKNRLVSLFFEVACLLRSVVEVGGRMEVVGVEVVLVVVGEVGRGVGVLGKYR